MSGESKAAAGGEQSVLVVLQPINKTQSSIVRAMLGEGVEQFSAFAEACGMEKDILCGYYEGHEISGSLASCGIAHGARITLLADAPATEHVSFADTHEDFRPFVETWYGGSEEASTKAANRALEWVKQSAERRKQAASGSGVKHIMWALKRYKQHPELLELMLRILAWVAIESDVAPRVLASGGLQLAMELGRKATTPLSTRLHAARFFFNSTYEQMGHTAVRLECHRQGALEHALHIILADPDVNTRDGTPMMLSAAKALVMLALVPELRPKMMEAAGMQQALLKLTTHKRQAVRLRGAKLVAGLALDPATASDLLKWGDVCASLYAMDESRKAVERALKALQSAS